VILFWRVRRDGKWRVFFFFSPLFFYFLVSSPAPFPFTSVYSGWLT
jgi:hypothetical protein